jgi:hypothetical protein
MSFLDDLKAGGQAALQAASNSVGNAVQSGLNSLGGVDNTPRTSNTAPTPDIAAIGARAQAALSNLSNSKLGGISIPLVIAAGLAAFLILRKR